MVLVLVLVTDGGWDANVVTGDGSTLPATSTPFVTVTVMSKGDSCWREDGATTVGGGYTHAADMCWTVTVEVRGGRTYVPRRVHDTVTVAGALKFKPELDDARITDHFEKEVNLKERMPELVLDWKWSKNVSLATRSDCNGGMTHVVHVTLADEAALAAYLAHPQHVEVGAIQGPLLEGKFVVDMQV